MAAEQKLQTDNDTYDLISVLYHALQGAETYGRYLHDAEEKGDHELVQFFRQAQSQNIELAAQGKALLARRLGTQSFRRDLVQEASEESFPASDSPATY